MNKYINLTLDNIDEENKYYKIFISRLFRFN